MGQLRRVQDDARPQIERPRSGNTQTHDALPFYSRLRDDGIDSVRDHASGPTWVRGLGRAAVHRVPNFTRKIQQYDCQDRRLDMDANGKGTIGVHDERDAWTPSLDVARRTLDDQLLIEKAPADIRDRLRAKSRYSSDIRPAGTGCPTYQVKYQRLVEVSETELIAASSHL
ncbi:hypothetical protein GCM10027568_30220 [Humibacter soli]